jgi:hypothetical protein
LTDSERNFGENSFAVFEIVFHGFDQKEIAA